MKKAFALFLVGLFVLSTVSATAPFETRELVKPSLYCGPNEVNCQPKIDIVFVIDSTGSMHDEIRTVKEELVNIIDYASSGQPSPDIKVGVVTYRDYEPEDQEYLTRSRQLTSNTESVVKFIRDIEARGGGDYEEAVEAGLNEAINDMKWRSRSTKLIILVGDAPGRNEQFMPYDYHSNYPEETLDYIWKDAIEDARDKGIRIYTASGSGMDDEGMYQWKTLARKTGGSFINLIYERRDVDDYYAERDIPKEYIAEARAARDYDASTDSVMTNNLGMFAKASIQSEAESAGVDYSNPIEPITGGVITTNHQNDLKNFFEGIFQKLKFWN